MQLPVKRWYPAIETRISRRQYNGVTLKEKHLAVLMETLKYFQPFTDVRAVLVTESPEDVFKGLVGSYGKVQGAPAYMAFVGNEKSPTVDENLGYLGEGLILEATALGLGTCWIAGSFNPEVVKRQIEVSANEKVYAVTPIGYTPKKTLGEKFMSFVVKSRKRKAFSEIVDGSVANLSPWAKTAIEAARLAPSAVNRQPWLFRIESDSSITVSEDSKKSLGHLSKRLDCGIAMLHFQLAAAQAGVQGSWEYQESPRVARFVPKK